VPHISLNTARFTALLRADLLLLIIAVIWGLAFAFQRLGADFLGPFSFNAARYSMAAGCLALLLGLRRSRKILAHGYPLAGGLLGLVLMAGTSLQQAGLAHTTAGKAGFITGLYVVLVPLLGLFFGQRPGWLTAAGALVAMMGLYFLSVNQQLQIGAGDLLVLASAFCWAAHVLLTGYYARRFAPLPLAFWQFVTTATLSVAAALMFEAPQPAHFLAAGMALLYTGIVATAVAFTLQIKAQQHSPPSHAALIMSLETVFAAFGGWWLLSETLTGRDMFGAMLMFTGMLLSQLALFRPQAKPVQATQT